MTKRCHENSAVTPTTPQTLRGSCLCGGVSFRVCRRENDARFALTWCHCTMCRKFHGAVMPCVTATDAQLEWGAGARENVRWFASSKNARRGSCKTCGSALFFRVVGDAETDIAAGAFDNPTGILAEDHIYTADKGDWYDLPQDDLPRFRGERK